VWSKPFTHFLRGALGATPGFHDFMWLVRSVDRVFDCNCNAVAPHVEYPIGCVTAINYLPDVWIWRTTSLLCEVLLHQAHWALF
jgi:hypothetical protein